MIDGRWCLAEKFFLSTSFCVISANIVSLLLINDDSCGQQEWILRQHQHEQSTKCRI
jgi:hypothetical protein